MSYDAMDPAYIEEVRKEQEYQRIIKAAEALVGYGLDLDVLSDRDKNFDQFIRVPYKLHSQLYAILKEYHKENK